MSTLLHPESEVREVSVIVTVRTLSGAGFAQTAENERIFTPKGVMTAVNLLPGDKLQMRIVENFGERRDDVPWRAIYAKRNSPSTDERPWYPSDATLVKRAEEHVMGRIGTEEESAWTVEQLFSALMQRPADPNHTNDAAALRALTEWAKAQCETGRLHFCCIYSRGVAVVRKYYSTDIELLEPWGSDQDEADTDAH